MLMPFKAAVSSRFKSRSPDDASLITRIAMVRRGRDLSEHTTCEIECLAHGMSCFGHVGPI
jgi:hypothetical protein